ncbi:MAG TPA: galactokinase family protein [Armatimonadota bacterium]|nr:galactokinase family protein [Armatimonadota bacterium]
MIRASAPGRAGIIGNPTDLYGGSVISCSISERAYCELSPSEQSAVRMDADIIALTGPESLALDSSKFDLAKAALQALEIDPSVHKVSISLRTDVPEQAGLAGSTAMLACAVGCLLAYVGLELNRYEVAETIRKIEADVMKITTGYQDQYMAVFGGLNYMDFRGKELMRQTKDEPFATLEPLSEIVGELPMILAHTGVKRFSGSVHKSLRERWLEGEKQVIEGYLRIAELGHMGKKAVLAQDWETLGKLMNENHAIQRDLGGSGESNERLIEAALSHGALGAKLAGAGGGGTIIALTEDPDSLAKALLDAGASRILAPKPAEGLVTEREWSVDYHKQGPGTH